MRLFVAILARGAPRRPPPWASNETDRQQTHMADRPPRGASNPPTWRTQFRRGASKPPTWRTTSGLSAPRVRNRVGKHRTSTRSRPRAPLRQRCADEQPTWIVTTAQPGAGYTRWELSTDFSDRVMCASQAMPHWPPEKGSALEPSTTTRPTDVHHACPDGTPVCRGNADGLYAVPCRANASSQPHMAVHARERRYPTPLLRERPSEDARGGCSVSRGGDGVPTVLRGRHPAADGPPQGEHDRRDP